MNKFSSFGEYLLAVARCAQMPGTRDARLETRGAAGASEAVPSDGGFLMQPEFVRPLIERVFLTGEILARCTEFPISQSNSVAFPQFDESSRANGSRFGGVQAYWGNEAGTATATKPKFLRSEIVAGKLICLVYLTEELFRDAAALEVFAMMAMSKEIAFRLEDAIVNGDGLDRPQGVMNSGALIQVAKQSTQAAGSIVAQNVIDVWSRMWAPSRKTAVFLASPDSEALCVGLTAAVGTGGAPIQLYRMTEDPENQPYNTLMGRPVIPVEYAPTPGTPGDLMLVDCARYALAMREARADVSLEIKFLTEEVAFRLVMRVGGQTIDARPITPMNGTNQVSPFVAIAQR